MAFQTKAYALAGILCVAPAVMYAQFEFPLDGLNVQSRTRDDVNT